MNLEHPPFLKLWTALPWLGTGLDARATPGWLEADEWLYGQSMIYGSGRQGDLLLRARAMIAALSALLACGIFVVARRLAGEIAGLAALALYALDPLAIAHAGLATTDLGGACFFFLAAIALPGALLRGGGVRIVACGSFIGLALASKFSNVTVLPVVGAIALVAAVLQRAGGERPGRRMLRAGGACLVALVVLAAAYGPGGVGLYLFGLDLLRVHGEVGHPTYAFGLYSREGWWWYFPAAWLVKTPVPILIASAGGIIVALSRFRSDTMRLAALLLPAGILLAAVMASGLNIGVRHLLPVTPFLAVWGGVAAKSAWEAGTWGRAAVLVLGVWLSVGTLRAHPNELAYANEPSGGPSRLWRKLADSNVDWGQSLPALADEVGRHPLRRLYLGYFGTADPAAYGLPYCWISTMTMIDPRCEDGPDPGGREWIALSVTHLLDVYATSPDLHAWLRERPFTAFPGYSIALFDVTGDAEAQRLLGETSLRVGDARAAVPPLRRAADLAPTDGTVRLDLARALAALGRLDEAVSECAEAERLSPGAEAEALCATIESAAIEPPTL